MPIRLAFINEVARSTFIWFYLLCLRMARPQAGRWSQTICVYNRLQLYYSLLFGGCPPLVTRYKNSPLSSLSFTSQSPTRDGSAQHTTSQPNCTTVPYHHIIYYYYSQWAITLCEVHMHVAKDSGGWMGGCENFNGVN